MNPTLDYIVQRLLPLYEDTEAREMGFWILEELFGFSRADVCLRQEPVSLDRIEPVLERLLRGEPLQYIFGHTLWRGLDIALTGATLIPRPETAELVDWILKEETEKTRRVLDLGTGSGCIAIALKTERPSWQVTGVDISEDVLRVAATNAQHHRAQIEWMNRNILKDVLPSADIIVSNPPYICEDEKISMKTNVLDFEPATALFVPSQNPLLFYRAIVSQKAAPVLYFEVNERFAHEVTDCMRQYGYPDTVIKQDMYGKERMVRGRMAM